MTLSERETELGWLFLTKEERILRRLARLSRIIAERDNLARLLAAESARVGELVGQVLELQRTLDEVVVVCDQTIDERNEAQRTMLLAVQRADAVTAERDALAAKLDRVRALHYAADNDAARTPVCEHCQGKAGVHSCGCWADSDRHRVCGHCYGEGRFERVSWPCPTLAILDADGDE